MLIALEEGVKGGVWFSLIDKVASKRNLEAAARRVIANKGGAGVDHVNVRQFKKAVDGEVEKLHRALEAGEYQPQAIRRVYIPKPGTAEKRPLGIPTVRDRTVQTALRSVLEPIFEKTFAECSYGFRPGRGCKDALRRVTELLSAGYTWVVDADLKGYFDTISHEGLMARVRERVTDGRVLELVESFLRQPIFENLQEWTPSEGTPQGAVISPLLSNIFLNPLDHLMSDAGYKIVRYADDFVVLCRTQEEAQRALVEIQKWTGEAGLTLHPSKTKIVGLDADHGFDFLGYHFRRSRRFPQRVNRWPREKSLKRVRDNLRPVTRRTNGRSLAVTIAKINPILRGWFEYYKHSTIPTDFVRLDGWIRHRLRSILRKRRKRKGRATGADHQRWPNAYFSKHGLLSLVAAHAEAIQSSRRKDHRLESRMRENRTYGSEGGATG
jgi:RNA-directed DNA polymerase